MNKTQITQWITSRRTTAIGIIALVGIGGAAMLIADSMEGPGAGRRGGPRGGRPERGGHPEMMGGRMERQGPRGPQGPGHPGAERGGKIEGMIHGLERHEDQWEELGVTQEKVDALKGLALSHEEEMIDLHAAAEKAQLGARHDVLDSDITEADLIESIEAVGKARTSIQVAQAKFMFKVRDTMGLETMKKMKEMRGEQMREGGPRRGLGMHEGGREGMQRGGRGFGPGRPDAGFQGQGGPRGPRGGDQFEGPRGPRGGEQFEGPHGPRGPRGGEQFEGTRGPRGPRGGEQFEGQRGPRGPRGPQADFSPEADSSATVTAE